MLLYKGHKIEKRWNFWIKDGWREGKVENMDMINIINKGEYRGGVGWRWLIIKCENDEKGKVKKEYYLVECMHHHNDFSTSLYYMKHQSFIILIISSFP